ncbi:MAG: DUF1592 domain-containing protein [Candidatus Poribacteria bacterium]|nr:DUF1592 domain-containing protein [Candidatus Poribacteria bacterium]
MKPLILYKYLSLPLFLTLLLIFISLKPSIGENRVPNFAKEGIPFLEKYCFGCHAGDQPEAGLGFDSYEDNMSLIKDSDIWDIVLQMVETRHMPPEGNEQPSLEEMESFVQHINAVFEDASRNAKPDPGRVTVRRLNKVEYRNSVRDLLGADFDPTESFPADDVGHGFDNIGDVLTMSPLLMERYLEAAEAIATRVIILDPPKPSTNYLNTKYLLPRHDSVRDQRFRPLDPKSTEPWLSGPFKANASTLKLLHDVETYLRATVYVETESEIPVHVALFIQGENLEDVSSPEELSQLIGVDPNVQQGIKILEIFEITARDPKKLQTIRHLVSRVPNIQLAGIAMVKPEQGEPQAILHIRAITSVGPLETRPESHLKILACTPDISQTEQTREVLTRLLRKAYRRPPSNQEIEELVQFAESFQAEGAKWEAAIQQAIKVILCSPKFLFRLELDDRPQTEEPHPIDEFHLASRLSYFLWSSIPDDELLELAEKNQLTESLETQIIRMLADPKANELATNFGAQWLQIQRLETVTPDPKRFPTFNPKLRADMMKETKLFLESIFREDRSILDLLDADYTFLNQRLAGHYEIWRNAQGEPIKGDAFQRVALQKHPRGGILTHASVLTVTSNPTRTSPVKRGRWVLEQILGAPPPPPPPDVPELEEEHDAITGTTLRERLEQHRDDPACANCHAKMDPIGFAMENYNAIGKYRTKDGEKEIDTAGQLPDGTSFEGITDLKQILKNRKRQFAQCVTEKMLIYAIGRGLEYYDRPTIEHIVNELETKDYKISVLITAIVKSDPFLLRRGTKG